MGIKGMDDYVSDEDDEFSGLELREEFVEPSFQGSDTMKRTPSKRLMQK